MFLLAVLGGASVLVNVGGLLRGFNNSRAAAPGGGLQAPLQGGGQGGNGGERTGYAPF